MIAEAESTALVARQPRSQTLVANVAALGASQVATWTVTLAWTLIVPRWLGPAGTGLLTLAWSLVGLLQILGGFVSRTLLVREIAARPGRAGSLLAAALIGRLICVPLCFIATAGYAWLGHFDAYDRQILLVAAGVSAALLVLEPAQAAFQAWERMQYLAYGEVLNKSLTNLAGIALVLLGFGPLALVWAMFSAAAVTLVLNVRWLTAHIRLEWSRSLTTAPGLVRQSMGFWAYTLFFTAYLWIDSTLLALLTPSQVLGWYGVPTRLFGSLLFLPVILATAWLPRLSSAWASAPERFAKVATRPLELVLVLGLPLGVGAAVVAPGLILSLYGPAFAPSIPVLQVLALTAIPMYVNIMIFQVLVASGRQNQWTVVLALAGLINGCVNVLMIQRFQATDGNGAIGAAISLFLTEALVCAVGLWMVRCHVNWRQASRTVRAVPAVAIMALGAFAVRDAGFVAQVVVGGITFCAAAYLFRVASEEDRADLATLGRGLLARVRRP